MTTTEIVTAKRTLIENEKVIERGQKTFLEVGEALREIRDAKQYSKRFDTFEDYCKSRWGMSRPRAYQFIEASEVVTNLSTIVDKSSLPKNENQARALASCADDDEDRAKVWEAVIKESSDKPITADVIKKKADEILPPKLKPSPKAEKPNPKQEEEPKQDKRTEFDPTKFDPEMVDESESVDTGKLVLKVDQLVASCESKLSSAFDELQKAMRSIDEANDAKLVPNHKSILGHYQRLFKEMEEAKTTMIQFVRGWKFRK